MEAVIFIFCRAVDDSGGLRLVIFERMIGRHSFYSLHLGLGRVARGNGIHPPDESMLALQLGSRALNSSQYLSTCAARGIEPPNLGSLRGGSARLLQQLSANTLPLFTLINEVAGLENITL